MTDWPSNLCIAVLASYGGFSILSFALLNSPLLDLAFFGFTLLVCISTALLDRKNVPNPNESTATRFQRVMTICYLLTLCLVIMTFIQYIYSLLFFAIQLIALNSKMFYIHGKSSRYLAQLALLLPSGIYATELVINHPTLEGNTFLLLFYIVWMLMLASLDHRSMSEK